MNLTKRDIRIAESMGVEPIENLSVSSSMKTIAHNTDVKSMQKEDLSAELNALLKMAYEAYEQSKSAAESVEDMMDEKCQTTAQATAAQQLNTAINAIDKVARLKLNILKLKKESGEDDKLPDGAVIMDRNELLRMLKNETS